MSEKLEVTRLNTGDRIPVQIDGENEFEMKKMDEPGYQIRFSTQYVVVTDSQLGDAMQRYERIQNLKKDIERLNAYKKANELKNKILNSFRKVIK